MTDIEGQESYTDHDGGEFSAVNVRVVATWPAPTFVENLAISRHRPWVSPSMRMARSGQRVGPFARALALYHGQRCARAVRIEIPPELPIAPPTRSGSSARHWRHGSVGPRRRGWPGRARRTQRGAAGRAPNARRGWCPAA